MKFSLRILDDPIFEQFIEINSLEDLKNINFRKEGCKITDTVLPPLGLCVYFDEEMSKYNLDGVITVINRQMKVL